MGGLVLGRLQLCLATKLGDSASARIWQHQKCVQLVSSAEAAKQQVDLPCLAHWSLL